MHLTRTRGFLRILNCLSGGLLCLRSSSGKESTRWLRLMQSARFAPSVGCYLEQKSLAKPQKFIARSTKTRNSSVHVFISQDAQVCSRLQMIRRLLESMSAQLTCGSRRRCRKRLSWNYGDGYRQQGTALPAMQATATALKLVVQLGSFNKPRRATPHRF